MCRKPADSADESPLTSFEMCDSFVVTNVQCEQNPPKNIVYDIIFQKNIVTEITFVFKKNKIASSPLAGFILNSTS